MLLRAALGATVLYECGIDLVRGSNPTVGIEMVGLIFAASGILLIIGFLTPCAAAVLGILQILAHAFASPGTWSLSACTPSSILAAASAAAIVTLGPGAWSVDARLFGLREIIIPTANSERPPNQP